VAEVARYTRSADQRRLARQAMNLLRAEREQNLPNIETQLYPTAKKG